MGRKDLDHWEVLLLGFTGQIHFPMPYNDAKNFKNGCEFAALYEKKHIWLRQTVEQCGNSRVSCRSFLACPWNQQIIPL